MARGYYVVKNPVTRLLPQFVRVWLGELYMAIDIYPTFTHDIRKAKCFPIQAFAEPYRMRIADGKMRPGMEDTIIRYHRR